MSTISPNVGIISHFIMDVNFFRQIPGAITWFEDRVYSSGTAAVAGLNQATISNTERFQMKVEIAHGKELIRWVLERKAPL